MCFVPTVRRQSTKKVDDVALFYFFLGVFIVNLQSLSASAFRSEIAAVTFASSKEPNTICTYTRHGQKFFAAYFIVFAFLIFYRLQNNQKHHQNFIFTKFVSVIYCVVEIWAALVKEDAKKPITFPILSSFLIKPNRPKFNKFSCSKLTY